MDVRFHSGVDDFGDVALPLYEGDPVRYTVEVSLLRGDMSSFRDVVFLSVSDGGDVIGVAMRTPPLPLLCSGIPIHAMGPVVSALRETPVPAVRGVRDVAEAFAAAWTSVTGEHATLTTEERLYRLDTLVAPVVAGSARPTTEDDLAVVGPWIDEFHVVEFGEESNVEAAAEMVRRAQAAGNQFLLWEHDGVPVSVGGVRRPSCAMSRIGPVFTPTELRGNGFGSAVTAACAQWAGARGATEVLLFTDLANPTSNRIYQRIGFRPVTDFARIDFAP